MGKESVYLNEIPLDLFFKYFNKETSVSTEIASVDKKRISYTITATASSKEGGNTYNFQFLKEIPTPNTTKTFDLNNAVISGTMSVYSCPIFILKFLYNNIDTISFNNNTNLASTDVQQLFNNEIPKNIKYLDKFLETKTISESGNNEVIYNDMKNITWGSFYPYTAVFLDSSNEPIYLNFSTIEGEKTTSIETPFIYECDIIRTGTDDKNFSINGLPNLNFEVESEDEEQIIAKIIAIAEENTFNIEKVFINKNKKQEEAERSEENGNLVYLKNGVKVVKIDNSSSIWRHHKLFSRSRSSYTPNTISFLQTIVPTGLGGIFSSNNAQYLMAYKKKIKKIIFKKINQEDIPAGIEPEGNELSYYIYNVIKKDNASLTQTSEEKIVKTLIDFSSLKTCDAIKIKENGEWYYESPISYEEGFYTVNIDGKNRIALLLKNPEGILELKNSSNILNSLDNLNKLFEFETTTTTNISYYRSTDFNIFYSIEEIEEEVISDNDGNDASMDKYNIISPLIYKYIRATSEEKDVYIPTPKYYIRRVNDKIIFPDIPLEIGEFKSRFINLGLYINANREYGTNQLAPSGVFKAEMENAILELSKKKFNNINKESFDISSLTYSNNTAMQMYVFSNGIYNSLKNKSEEIPIRKRELIKPSDISLRFSFIEKNNTQILKKPAEDIINTVRENREIIANREYNSYNSLQRLANYNGFGLTSEQINSEVNSQVLIDYLNCFQDGTLYSFDIEKITKKYIENKARKVLIKEILISHIKSVLKNNSVDLFFKSFEQFIEPKLSGDNILIQPDRDTNNKFIYTFDNLTTEKMLELKEKIDNGDGYLI